MTRIAHGAERRLTLLLGPSGSGKSVLLAQWAARQREAVAALTVDPIAVDAVSFGHQLASALGASSSSAARAGFGTEALRHLEAGGERMGAPFLHALATEMADLPRTHLVLDDAQVLPAPLVDELGDLLRLAPRHISFVIASQRSLPLDIGRLRALGEVTELVPSELAFDDGGVAAVVDRVAGIRLDGAQRARLLAATRGWPVGVQLAALALRERERSDVDAYLERFDGTDQAVADYLAEEVVARQPPELQEVLRRTAVLDAFDAELCDLVTRDAAGPACEQAVSELVRRHLFLIPLDARHGWYRYHHLFADLLRFQLRADDPGLHDELLVRAARWHLERDERPQAIEYLLRARRWEEALDVICGHGYDWFAEGESATAIHWLNCVPAEERWRHRQANYTLAMLHRLVGNVASANALFDQIDLRREQGERGHAGTQYFRAMGCSWEVPPERAMQILEAALAWFQVPGQYEGSRPPLRPSEPSLEWVLGSVRLTGARCLVLLDRYDDARRWVNEMLGLVGHNQSRRVSALGVLATVEALAGTLDAVSAPAEEALAVAKGMAPLNPTAAADAHLGLGLAALEHDQLDLADHHLHEAEMLVRVNRMTALVAAVTAARARVALGRGLPRHGLALITQHRREDAPTVAPSVTARLAAAEANLLAELGDLAGAKRALARAPHTGETFSVAVRVALAEGDTATAGAVLERWPCAEGVRSQLQRLLRAGQLADALRDHATARDQLEAAASLALGSGHRRVLFEGGPALRALLARYAGASSPASSLRALGTQVPLHSKHHATPAAGTGLSDRELEVVACLAGPLSNREVADHLGISANTLKTHLKSIYRKLGVTRRRAAVERAAQLGLRPIGPSLDPGSRPPTGDASLTPSLR